MQRMTGFLAGKSKVYQRAGSCQRVGLPSGALASAGVFQLCFYLVYGRGQVLVIVIAQHGVGRSGEDVGGVQLFKLPAPAGRFRAARQVAVPVVAQQKQRVRSQVLGTHKVLHATRHLRLRGKLRAVAKVLRLAFVDVAPVAKSDGVRRICTRVRRR